VPKANPPKPEQEARRFSLRLVRHSFSGVEALAKEDSEVDAAVPICGTAKSPKDWMVMLG